MGSKREAGTSNVNVAADPNYDLISVLYHALKGAETYAAYIDDASGDDELLRFFREVKADEERIAARAMELLTSRLSKGGREVRSTNLDMENAAE